MKFKTEKERLMHPQAKLIPQNLWIDVFVSHFDEIDAEFFSKPLDSLLNDWPSNWTSNEKQCALVILLIRYPDIERDKLLSFVECSPQINIETLFYFSVSLGLVHLLNDIKKLNKSLISRVVNDPDSTDFYTAVKNGHTNVLDWHLEQAPKGWFSHTIKVAFCRAIEYGQLDCLKWIVKQVPDELDSMFEQNNYYAFRLAAENGPILMQLVEQVPKKKLWGIVKIQNCYVLHYAARSGQLETLKWIAEQVPKEFCDISYMIFRDAAVNDHQPIANWLLSSSLSCFEFVESHDYEYGAKYIHPFIHNYLTELHHNEEAYYQEYPNGVFELSDKRQFQFCFYMVRNLIRRNDRSLDEEFRFLLNIPGVKALAHQAVTPREENELLRLALTSHNSQAAELLLNIDAVRSLAEQHDFYRSEQRGELNLRTLAQNRESSMTGLTTGEQMRLEGAIKHYEPMIKNAGVTILMNELRAMLLERYELNPATITINDKKIVLPALWTDFQALHLSKESYAEALNAYFKHSDHTAWRYLSKPNPWMSPDASYVNGNPNNPNERWSTFGEYQSLIVMLWLAAMDETIKPTQGHTLEGRLDNFIKELALLGRAHNWDRTRLKSDGKTTEEYDDEKFDKPSCFSGVKRRLFQSVVGHPLLSILTRDMVTQELRDFVRAHFDAVIKKDPKSKALFLPAYEYCVVNLDYEGAGTLKPLNLTEEQQNELITQLKNKYLKQFSEDLKNILYIKDQLSLKDSKEDPFNAYHALKLDGLTHYFEAMLLKQKASSEGKVSEMGLFSGVTEESCVKEITEKELLNLM